MTPPISKEAMEKATFIADNLPPKTIDALLGGGHETRDALIDILALEFTAYQKRVEELDEMLRDLVICESVSCAECRKNMAMVLDKSHLAKGVKEE